MGVHVLWQNRIVTLLVIKEVSLLLHLAYINKMIFYVSILRLKVVYT